MRPVVSVPAPAAVGAQGLERRVFPFVLVALGFNILLTIVELFRPLIYPGLAGGFGVTALATAIALPLHLRHVVFGMRGERPPAGKWTLAALAAVNAAALVTVGTTWLFQLASFAVSILIVVPGAWSVVLCAAVVLLPLVLTTPIEFPGGGGLYAPYITLAVAWRTVTQFVPVRLAATIRHVAAAQEEIRARAVIDERIRIDQELRGGVGRALEKIVTRGEAAAAVVSADPPQAVAELGLLARESRGALAAARRLVASYRSASVGAELHTAVSLLEASGARVRVIVADDVVLDPEDDRARRAIHGALLRTLHRDPQAGWILHVTRDAAGDLAVDLTPENAGGAP